MQNSQSSSKGEKILQYLEIVCDFTFYSWRGKIEILNDNNLLNNNINNNHSKKALLEDLDPKKGEGLRRNKSYGQVYNSFRIT